MSTSHLTAHDLRPLAWIMGELRQSLDEATKKLRLFARHLASLDHLDLAALNVSELHTASYQLHQVVGALNMVGLNSPARVSIAMQTAVDKFVQCPELCTIAAAATLERAALALTQYLECVLADKPVSAVSLFAQYRQTQELTGARRIHPADLWSFKWRWIEPHISSSAMPPQAQDEGEQTRLQFDHNVLQLIKDQDRPQAAQRLIPLCLALSHARASRQSKVFWKIAAAFFEAIAHDLVPVDIYVKRAASGVLRQYAHAISSSELSERFAQDLLFFCARAIPPHPDDTPLLTAVRTAYGLEHALSIDYDTVQFGRFDPALLAQIRKRIHNAKEGWSALLAGDVQALPTIGTHFRLLCETLIKLYPSGEPLAQVLSNVAESVAHAQQTPAVEVATEVATTLLYLQAAFGNFSTDEEQLTHKMVQLAQRLDAAQRGQKQAALEPWMQELYRQIGDKQAIGSVVGQLRIALDDLEKSLGLFFRQRQDTTPLHHATTQLSQIRSVLSVLGLDDACQAVISMRASVEELLRAPLDEQTHEISWAPPVFDKLSGNLGALSFLVDMLNYQPVLAKQLFEYDAEQGKLICVMDRPHEANMEAPSVWAESNLPDSQTPDLTSPSNSTHDLEFSASEMLDLAIEQPCPTPTAQTAVTDLPADPALDLRGVFLQEARDVLAQGQTAVQALCNEPADMRQFIVLHRVFHTLKGSAHMVDLGEFSSAAWSMEQLLNDAISLQKPATPEFCTLLLQALSGLTVWIDDVAIGRAGHWRASAFCTSADAMRLGHPFTALAFEEPSHDEPTQAALDDPSPQTSLLFSDLTPKDSSVSGLTAIAQDMDTLQIAQASEDVKVIDTLQIPIAQYNLYLNEADEWSRRLSTEISEWSLEIGTPINDSTLELTQTLANSSALLGLTDLSQLVQALEGALHQSQIFAGSKTYTALCLQASEELRRLLHQFAAGFLKQADPKLLQTLQQIALCESSPALPSELSPLYFTQRQTGADTPPEQSSQELPVIEQPSSQKNLAVPTEPADTANGIAPGLLTVFTEEAQELLAQLDKLLRHEAAHAYRKDWRIAALHALHTLKGSARSAGAMQLGEIAHDLESSVDELDSVELPTTQRELLLAGLDALQASFDALCQPPSYVQTHLTAHTAVTAGGAAVSLVRVNSRVLDSMVNQASQLMVSRSRLEVQMRQLRTGLHDLRDNLDRLGGQLRDVQLEASSLASQKTELRVSASSTGSPGFDPLELEQSTPLQELSCMMAESVNDVVEVAHTLQQTVDAARADLMAQTRQARQLQHDLLHTRMVDFASIAERLSRVVQQACQETGKEVEVQLSGGKTEIDRLVLDRMSATFEHLLRNAVVHGIEAAPDRLRAGKPVKGVLTVDVQQTGHDVSVGFRDDGAGLDLVGLRQKAQDLGLISPKQELSDSQLIRLIFTPGLSMASQVTELAGRGIGMDVVHSAVASLGGRIEVNTQAGQGSYFRLIFPLSTAITRIVLCRVDGICLGVPAHLVQTVIRVPLAQIQQASNSGHLHLEEAQAPGTVSEPNKPLPFFWAGALLRSSPQSSRVAAPLHTILILRSAGQPLALYVDEVLHNYEVLVRNLGPQLSQLPGLTGVAVLPLGSLALIYNPVALASVYGQQAKAWAAQATPALTSPSSLSRNLSVSTQTPCLLVVDDSITVRRMLQHLLEREGFRVMTANDGLQALECLQQERVRLVLTDIEMPRMSGFELVRHMRAHENWTTVPVIMLTSRISQKHQDHAQTLGIAGYLGKPYEEGQLLALVRSVCSHRSD